MRNAIRGVKDGWPGFDDMRLMAPQPDGHPGLVHPRAAAIDLSLRPGEGSTGAASLAALSSRAMSSSSLRQATVDTVEPLSAWAYRVSLQIEGSDPFDFEPGQYISLHLPLHDGHEHVRHFSIASPPGGNRIELCLTRSSTVSNSAADVPAPGEHVRFSGPKGGFRLREPVDRDTLFIATGTGISPLRPMIRRALDRGGVHTATLLYGVRTESDILYRSEFEGLAAADPRFRFLVTLSRAGPGWAGLSGYVQAHLDRVLGERTDLDVYVCGLKGMLEEVRPHLRDRGIPRAHVHYEKHD